MSKLVFTTFLVSLVVTSTTGRLKEQQSEYTKQAELDAQGNIYVSSDQGKLIWMANTKHCSEASEASDHQTVGCRDAGSGTRQYYAVTSIGNLSERRPQGNH